MRRDLPPRLVEELRTLIRTVGAPGQLLTISETGTVVLTSPFLKWQIPADVGDQFTLVEEIRRQIRASSTDNPLQKYIYLKGLSYRKVGALLGYSHIRVREICRTNPGDEVRARIARIFPEVGVDSWPQPPRVGRPPMRRVHPKMKKFYGG